MTKQLPIIDPGAAQDPLDGGRLAALTVGQAANRAAAAWSFLDYRGRKSANTLRNHDAALDQLATFLRASGAAEFAGVEGHDLARDAAEWRGVTWGIVEVFKIQLLEYGYSIATVNNRLSTIRVYAGLASKAAAIPASDLTLIKAVAGYGVTEGKRVDERRPRSRRDKSKKAAAVGLTLDQARRLKMSAGTTGQAERDAFIMALLLDHGLRVGELAGLTVEALDLDQGLMTFYRPKVDMTQTHRMTAATATAARRYLAMRPSGAGGGVWVASDRRGRLLPRPMSARAISKRVGLLGLDVGAAGLSPHDCRHYWATNAANSGTGVFNLRDAGGWSSVAMPARYVEAAAVANDGVRLRQ